MDQTDSRLAHSTEPASDDAASPFNLKAHDRQDLLDFEPVPLRYRTDGLSPEKQRVFVEALADTGVVREAAARAGVSEQAINRARRRADGRDFDRACEAAHLFGARRLRSIAFERAIEGSLKGHYYHGELVSQERVYDNRLLVYLLGKIGHLLEPSEECRSICDRWDEHMEALEQGVEPLASELDTEGRSSWVWEDEKTGALLTSFPPPDGFEGEEQGAWDGVNWYCRTLAPAERAAIEARDAEEIAEARAREADRRDLFFGFAGDGLSPPGEAEPSETSEPFGEALGPIEYKSLIPPSFRRRPVPRNTKVRGSSPRRSSLPAFAGTTQDVRDDLSGPTSKPPSAGILGDEPPGAST